jgi:hypothetical protein
MTIAAILDLDKAIETFKNKIQTLLLVGDLSNWDGTMLQEREQAMRVLLNMGFTPTNC